jgi:hypothetical protein
MPSIDRLSLGWRSELIFPRFDAQVIERPDYLLIRTPQNPTFWWGNFLLFDRAPREGDAAVWAAAFEREIVQQQPESRHLAFGVDAPGPIEMPADFAALGLTPMQGAVLTLAPPQPKPPRQALGDGWRIRPLRLPDRRAPTATTPAKSCWWPTAACSATASGRAPSAASSSSPRTRPGDAAACVRR